MKIFSFGKCIVPKNVKGTHLDSLTYIVLQNIKIFEGGPFGVIKKISKVARCQKKNPLVSSSFVGYVKKVKNESWTLCTNFVFAGFGLSGFTIISKKWIDQCEVCGLTKKGYCNSRAFFPKREKR